MPFQHRASSRLRHAINGYKTAIEFFWKCLPPAGFHAGFETGGTAMTVDARARICPKAMLPGQTGEESMSSQTIGKADRVQSGAVWPLAAFHYARRPPGTWFTYKGRPAAKPAEPPKSPAPSKSPAPEPAKGAPEPAAPQIQEPGKKA
jgi:hypothetical protein